MICLRLKASSWRGEARGAACPPSGFRRCPPARIAGCEVAEQQLAVSENHRQQIVEVVRDAAGQPADRFHLLRLLILLLERCGAR